MLTDEQIYDWWASENGMEDFDLCKLEHFRKVIRAVEQKLAGEQVHPDTKDAMRYRFLRDTGDATWRPFGIRAGYSAAQADAAIDAAIQGGNSTEGAP